jgi:hypothetical protein
MRASAHADLGVVAAVTDLARAARHGMEVFRNVPGARLARGQASSQRTAAGVIASTALS